MDEELLKKALEVSDNHMKISPHLFMRVFQLRIDKATELYHAVTNERRRREIEHLQLLELMA